MSYFNNHVNKAIDLINLINTSITLYGQKKSPALIEHDPPENLAAPNGLESTWGLGIVRSPPCDYLLIQ